MNDQSSTKIIHTLLGIILGIAGTILFQELKEERELRKFAKAIEITGKTINQTIDHIAHAEPKTAAILMNTMPKPVYQIQTPPTSNWNRVRNGNKVCYYRTVGKQLEKKCEETE